MFWQGTKTQADTFKPLWFYVNVRFSSHAFFVFHYLFYQRCWSASRENWCVKAPLVVSHFLSAVMALPTVFRSIRMNPAAMVTYLYLHIFFFNYFHNFLTGLHFNHISINGSRINVVFQKYFSKGVECICWSCMDFHCLCLLCLKNALEMAVSSDLAAANLHSSLLISSLQWTQALLTCWSLAV